MKKALKVTPDFQTEVLDIEQDFLTVMQGAVEGLIQPIGYSETLTMWVNEEFYSLKDPRPNFIATTFYSILGVDQTLLGNVVFTSGTDGDGEVLGLDEVTLSELLSVVAEAKSEVMA